MRQRRPPSPRTTKSNLMKAELRVWRITQKQKSKKVALCLPNVRAVRFYLFVIFCVAMIFSCWGSFQREVFWLKLTLWGSDDDDDDEKWLLPWWWWGGRFDLLHLHYFMEVKQRRDECSQLDFYAFKLHCQCATLYLHCNALSLNTFWKSVLQMHAQKQAGFKMQPEFSARYKCIENTAKQLKYWHVRGIIECIIKCVTFPVGRLHPESKKQHPGQHYYSLYSAWVIQARFTPLLQTVYSHLQ